MVYKQLIDRKQFVKINLTRNSKIYKTAHPDTIDVQMPIIDTSNGGQHLYYYP